MYRVSGKKVSLLLTRISPHFWINVCKIVNTGKR